MLGKPLHESIPPVAFAGYGACDVAYLLWDQIASNVVQDSRAWKQELFPRFSVRFHLQLL